MPFPFVAVTLPDDTPPAYVAGLLSACSQAYPEGSCRRDSDSSSPATNSAEGTGSPKPEVNVVPDPPRAAAVEDGESPKDVVILANITWSDATTATVLLGLPHWRNQRWIERSVPFKEHDQPLERYRALGFTVGSLAVTVAEVARLEREAREPLPESPKPHSEPPPEAKPQPPPPTSKPLTPPRPNDPLDTIDAREPPDDDEPSTLFVRGYVAGEMGEGFDTVRKGGALGLGLFGRRWGGHVSGYYTDASRSGLDATFAGLELTLDLRFEWEMLEANVRVGGGYGNLTARIDKEASALYPTGIVGVNLMPSRWRWAPYFGFGMRLFRGVETDAPGLDTLGPLTPYLQLGLALGSQSNSRR